MTEPTPIGPGSDPAPMKILLVSARYAPFMGGTEIHTGSVAAELAARGHHVTVVTTDLTGELAPTERVDGVDVIRVGAWPQRSDLYIAPEVRKVINSADWDLVHVQGYHTAIAPLALAAAQARKIPTVLTFHSGGHSSRLRNALRPVQARFLKRWLVATDLLIGVSEFEADLFAARLRIDRERIVVIPNGVPGDGPRAVPPVDFEPTIRLRAVATGPTILSIGRLVRYKGHHRVIRAMPHLLELVPSARLVILGKGPYRAKLERLIGRLGLDDHVTIDHVPPHDRPLLMETMERASAAILLSTYESHGMAAHEALSRGLPVVVLDSSALSELVSAGLARAVPPQATDAEIARIIARTLAADDDRRRSSRRAADQGQSQPRPRSELGLGRSWADIVDRLEERYRQLVGQPPDTRRYPPTDRARSV